MSEATNGNLLLMINIFLLLEGLILVGGVSGSARGVLDQLSQVFLLPQELKELLVLLFALIDSFFVRQELVEAGLPVCAFLLI